MDDIKCKSLTLVDDKGKAVLTLAPASSGAGMWITGPEGNLVAIFSLAGQTGIGLYSKESLAKGGPMPICLTVDDKGHGCIQLEDEHGVFHVSAADLRDLAKPSQMSKIITSPKP